MKILYLDESGDHNLQVIDPTYPLFVIGGVLVDDVDVHEIEEQFHRLKTDLFGNPGLVLHTADVGRSRNGFEGMRNPAFRQRVISELNALMRRLRYEVVAVAVMKRPYVRRHGVAAADPYVVGLRLLVEQLCHAVGAQVAGARILAERRVPNLDQQTELTWQQIQLQGAGSIQPATVRERIESFELHAKAENIAGLQLADLVIGPLGRDLIGKTRHDDFHIVESKLRRRPRSRTYVGAGLTVLP